MPAISPKEAKKRQLSAIPEVIFDVVNQMLADGKRTIRQPDLLQELKLRMKPEEYAQVFEKGWLDFEPHYRKSGWSVAYDKPGYCESYEAYWDFAKKGSR